MTLKDKNKQDLISGAVFVLLALIGLILLPSQVPPMTKSWGVMKTLPGGHRLFPMMSLILFGVFGLVLIISELATKKKAVKKDEKKSEDFTGFWITALSWGVYAIAVTHIGYLVSTFGMLLFLFKYYGIKSWKKMIIIALLVVLFVYIIFVRLMRISFSSRALLF